LLCDYWAGSGAAFGYASEPVPQNSDSEPINDNKGASTMNTLPKGYIAVADAGIPLLALKLFTNDLERFQRLLPRAEALLNASPNTYAAAIAGMSRDEALKLCETMSEVQAILSCLVADLAARHDGASRQSDIEWLRTNEQLEQLDKQIYQTLEGDHPQSVRHVFYRMTDPRLAEPVPKSDQGYNVVQRRCLLLRRAGVLPYSWISDTSRMGYHVNTYASASDYLREVAGLYRANLWEQPEVPTFCEVWVESRSLAGTLIALCRELAVSLYPAGGFTSASFAHSAAEGLNANGVTKVFYIGDYDPAGVLIDVSIERELRSHLNPGVCLDFERIGITPEQIERYDLPTKPRKEGDRRALHIERTVEAEAMPAGLMRSILRQRIESLLPPDALRVAKVAEQSEREHLVRVANMLRNEK
jgi:hypothetical protein